MSIFEASVPVNHSLMIYLDCTDLFGLCFLCVVFVHSAPLFSLSFSVMLKRDTASPAGSCCLWTCVSGVGDEFAALRTGLVDAASFLPLCHCRKKRWVCVERRVMFFLILAFIEQLMATFPSPPWYCRVTEVVSFLSSLGHRCIACPVELSAVGSRPLLWRCGATPVTSSGPVLESQSKSSSPLSAGPRLCFLLIEFHSLERIVSWLVQNILR